MHSWAGGAVWWRRLEAGVVRVVGHLNPISDFSASRTHQRFQRFMCLRLAPRAILQWVAMCNFDQLAASHTVRLVACTPP